jgi:hypothetical protein
VAAIKDLEDEFCRLVATLASLIRARNRDPKVRNWDLKANIGGNVDFTVWRLSLLIDLSQPSLGYVVVKMRETGPLSHSPRVSRTIRVYKGVLAWSDSSDTDGPGDD